jgi:hypothetical protein
MSEVKLPRCGNCISKSDKFIPGKGFICPIIGDFVDDSTRPCEAHNFKPTRRDEWGFLLDGA